MSHQTTDLEVPTTGATHRVRGIIQKTAITLAAAAALSLGVAQPAHAAVVSAGDGRATIYLSQSETRALGQGSVPAPPAATPWQLRAAYYALAYGHRWFAQQYANRGWCSGFRLSIYPWESQGYFGYACNWRRTPHR